MKKRKKLPIIIRYLIGNTSLYVLHRMNEIFGYELIVEDGQVVKIGVEL